MISPLTAEWYYIGHYGQLGPLTREQIDELVEGGVILRDTWIWRAGMSEWIPAEQVADLASSFRRADPYLAPPPSPPSPLSPSQRGAARMPEPPRLPEFDPLSTQGYYPMSARSEKSRSLGGLLQIVPGIGRIYLGYTALGVVQLVTSLCGVGVLWSWADGIYILCGGVPVDGTGRRLQS